MSNYPNMSYCMCENTMRALDQVLTAMQEEGPMFVNEMGREERAAYKRLFNMCEDFLTAAEELEDELERSEV